MVFEMSNIENKFLCDVKEVNFDIKGDDRGKLAIFEKGFNIPFDIKRVFYIYGADANISRGHHAHYKTRQLLIAVSGSVIINCEWKENKKSFILNSPDKGLLIDGMVWHTMDDFSQDCVLMVIADSSYDEADYIRDYNDFLKETAK